MGDLTGLVVLLALVMAFFFALWAQVNPREEQDTPPEPILPPPARPLKPHAARLEHPKPPEPPQADGSIEGRVYVVDGDTVVIQKIQIRLFGVDAPELNHPYGQKAKWALVALCRGQHVRAEIVATDCYQRTVARCFLEDGRDLSAEMVRSGLAIDWPKFSGGIYGAFEVPNARKKMWLADARQKGRMHIWAQFEARQASSPPNPGKIQS